MKRKVSKIGPSTLMVSLPSKWVKAYGIKQGDELEVIENNAELSIKRNASQNMDTKTIDVSGLDAMLTRIIGGVYKKGYGNIKVVFSNNKQLKDIYKVLGTTCVGLEVLDAGKSHVNLRQVAVSSPEEFKNLLHRTFIFLLDNVQASVEAIKDHNVEELNNLILNDLNINKYSDMTRRLINTKVLSGGIEGPLYYLAEELEKIGDVYRDLFSYVVESKLKFSPKLMEVYLEANNFLNQFYKLFYTFNFADLEELHRSNFMLKIKIKSLYDSLPNKEMRALFFIENIQRSVFDLNGSLIVINV